MYDDPGFITLSIVSALVITGVFVALIKAAVMDGRIDSLYAPSSRYRPR